MIWDLPPKIWLPPKPAIIRPVPVRQANFLPGTFPAIFVAAAAATLTGSYVTTGQDAGDGGGALSIGAAPTGDERRWIVCVCTAQGGTTPTIQSPTIGATSATIVVQDIDLGGIDGAAGIIYAEITSGTTASIDGDWDAGTSARFVHVYRLITTNNKALSVTDFDSVGGGTSLSIDIAAGGFVIAGQQNDGGVGQTTYGGTLTTDNNTDAVSDDWSSAGSAAFASAQTGQSITADTSGAFVTASFNVSA